MAYNILIVDDQEDIRSLISDILSDEGYICRLAANSQQAIDEIRHQRPHLVILDVWLNDSRFDGIEVLDIIKETYPDLPIVMISGHGTIETAVNALKKGADDFIEKPFKTERLLHIVEKSIEKYTLKQELQELRKQVSPKIELYGSPQRTQQLKQQIDKIAKTNSRVLIEGPPGTGKKIIARLLHQQSARANNPFVMVNCAAIHPQRFEEEFLGTTSKNAGGSVLQLGYLEKADAGTLFLDNVGDLPLEMQGKLLQVLQNKTFYRLGSSKSVQVDIRVIAANREPLKHQVDAGKFREDLYYRLAVVPLTVLSLKEQPSNIIPIAEKFLEKAGIHSKFTSDAQFLLESFDWHGNIRQLKNVIEWMCIIHPEIKDNPIESAHLPPELTKKTQDLVLTDINTNFLSLPLREAREEFEKVYLNMHIKRFKGNITKTANAIGMERTALHRKIKLLNFTDESPHLN